MNKFFVSLAVLLLTGGPLLQGQESADQRTQLKVRSFEPANPDNWKGNGISYGPYRDGQGPDQGEPSKEEVAEDLKILADDGWQMIRLYGTEPFARKTCEFIQQEDLPLKVMLGAWVKTEKDLPKNEQDNQGQVDRAIALANDFPEIVAALER